jgi:hypothetical protein
MASTVPPTFFRDKIGLSWAWLYTIVISALKKLRQEDGKFKANVGLHSEF